jgi:hypothetical protein
MAKEAIGVQHRRHLISIDHGSKNGVRPGIEPGTSRMQYAQDFP